MQSVILIVSVSEFLCEQCEWHWEQASIRRSCWLLSLCASAETAHFPLLWRYSSQKERKHTFNIFCADNMIKTSICDEKQTAKHYWPISCAMFYYSQHISVPFLIMLSIIFIYFFTSGYSLWDDFEPVRSSPISSVYSTLTHCTKAPQFFFLLYRTPDGSFANTWQEVPTGSSIFHRTNDHPDVMQ